MRWPGRRVTVYAYGVPTDLDSVVLLMALVCPTCSSPISPALFVAPHLENTGVLARVKTSLAAFAVLTRAPRAHLGQRSERPWCEQLHVRSDPPDGGA